MDETTKIPPVKNKEPAPPLDPIDQASIESFPASDSPAWFVERSPRIEPNVDSKPPAVT